MDTCGYCGQQEEGPHADKKPSLVLLPTNDEMAALDRRAAEEFGVPTLLLMEAAGRAVADAARILAGRPRLRAVIVAGKGNNGGDGLVAGRLLLAAGCSVTVVLVGRDAEVGGDAGVNLQAARRAGTDIINLDSVALPGLRSLLSAADVIIDGLFGTGFRGPAVGLAGKTIEAVNAVGRPVLAIDIPSGVQGETGAVGGSAVRASATVTMGLPKIGLVVLPGAEYAGRIWVADVGHPKRLLDDAAATIRTALVTRAMVDAVVPHRRADAHKGDFGRILVVAGSVGHSGAAVLACLGALRGGAGLVTLGIPAAIYPVIGPAVVEGMPVPLPDQDGALASDAAAKVLELVGSADVVACGPGLSRLPGPGDVVRTLVTECPKPLVLDADALNHVAAMGRSLPPARAPLILTPHPGEAARLLSTSKDEIQRTRLQAARTAAALFSAIVVLKGARTIVAAPDGTAYLVPTGNPAMATGGMGDVLTGVIAALLGCGLKPVEAAWAGAYLHGLAGDQAVAARGPAGILARDVAECLPEALRAVRSGTVTECVAPLPVP